jgi:hypothetical protein
MCVFSSKPSLPVVPPPETKEPAKPLVSPEASQDTAAKARQSARRGLRIDLAPAGTPSVGLNIPQ